MNVKERIFADIDAEHQQVLGKWGVQVHEKKWWLIFLFEEFGELAKALAEYNFRQGPIDDVYDEAIQVATLSIKIYRMAKLSSYIWSDTEEFNPCEIMEPLLIPNKKSLVDSLVDLGKHIGNVSRAMESYTAYNCAVGAYDVCYLVLKEMRKERRNETCV